MIRTFADKDTEALWLDKRTRIAPDLAPRAHAKLVLLHSMKSLDALRFPPGNKLEALSGNRAGQHSIRINDKWRLCFRWDARTSGAYDVEICDYH